MFDHERFRELSSLAATGQLSADENDELSKHLIECESCRAIHDDYSHLIQHQLPKADVTRRRKRAVSFGLPPDSEIRDRFFGRARAEGVEFSAAAERPNRASGFDAPPKPRVLWLLAELAVCASVVVLFLGVGGLRKYRFVGRSDVAKVFEHTAGGSENTQLRAQIDILRHTIESESAQLDETRKENALSKGSLQKLEMELQQERVRGDQLSSKVEAADSERTALNDKEQQEEAFISRLRAQNDELGRLRAENLSDLVIQKQEARVLTESLERETADLERERQLMTVTSDVRQLMGARNLHIMDVRDVNADTKSAKAFGRVFYAEGQSLIFYAFDLPAGGLSPAKYTFHAWADKDLSSESPRSLGTFQVDDHEQRRWILKVNDPAILAGVESVFVTAESLRDTKEPRGKKLLYAYIAGQPNHP